MLIVIYLFLYGEESGVFAQPLALGEKKSTQLISESKCGKRSREFCVIYG